MKNVLAAPAVPARTTRTPAANANAAATRLRSCGQVDLATALLAMAERKASDLSVECLEAEGVQYVFSVKRAIRRSI
jgi:hypothetical protein